MPHQLSIKDFLSSAQSNPVIDVRSPSEFARGHMPGAHSMPLFSDDERHEVGLTYKDQSREEAFKKGLDFVGSKMRSFVEFSESLAPNKAVLLYCWRGGMRSASVAWLLETYGFQVTTLQRGYKAWRAYAAEIFSMQHKLHILGGNTGAGKTKILHELEKQGEPIIDLERLAGHKGSAFGWLGEDHQPTQEHFENMLAHELIQHHNQKAIWLEDESQRIGNVNIPNALWSQVLAAPLLYLNMPLPLRAENLAEDYGNFSDAELADAINRISKKLGGEKTKAALAALAADDKKAVAEICLAYYDKYYARGLELREAEKIHELKTTSRFAEENARLMMEKQKEE